MNEIIYSLLYVVSICLVLCMVALWKDGRAYEWFSEYNNQRLVRKCFGQEGIYVQIHTCDRTVRVSFSKKGVCYAKTLTFAKAYDLYHECPTGQGMRNKLICLCK